jgi:hypothetical protein
METDRKLNNYVKYFMNVELKITDMKDVEVVRNGEKLKMQHGRVQATVGGKFQLDWQKQFDGNKFLKALEHFYHNILINTRIEDHYGYIGIRIDRLQSRIKQVLGTETHG